MTPAPTTPASVAEVLDRAADLIEPEGRWTQGVYARGKSGREVETRKSAACFCILGAISYINGDAPAAENVSFREVKAVRNAIGLDCFGSVSDWNDAPERTQAEVVAALRSAAEAARGEGK